jgi:hypothetical protein
MTEDPLRTFLTHIISSLPHGAANRWSIPPCPKVRIDP